VVSTIDTLKRQDGFSTAEPADGEIQAGEDDTL
jgi:hypothetical protein